MSQLRIKDITTEFTDVPEDGYLLVDSEIYGSGRISVSNLNNETETQESEG